VIVSDCDQLFSPRTVILLERALPELGATAYHTGPLPLPLAEVIVIHPSLLVAAHVHPGPVNTSSVKAWPPSGPKSRVVYDKV
jgi:hypothetical protein